MKRHFNVAKIAVVAGSFALGLLATQLQATVYTLAPGGVLSALPSSFPVGGTLQQTLTAPFSSDVLSGTLTSRVLAGDSSNPYGGLTFTYQINVSPDCNDAATQLSVSSFGSFATDVSYNNLAGGDLPFYVSRSSAGNGGAVVRFTFLDAGTSQTIAPGQMSALLIIQTDAQNWMPSTAAITDGQAINVNSLAAMPVPEPGTAALLLLGVGALVARAKFQA